VSSGIDSVSSRLDEPLVLFKMFVKTFAVLSVLSGTAVPVIALSIHAVTEAHIPHCSIELPASEPICKDAVTGLKFEHQYRRRGMVMASAI